MTTPTNGTCWDYEWECELSLDGDWAVTQFDRALAERLGYPVAELVGEQTWVKVTIPEDGAHVLRSMRELAEGRPVRSWFRMRARSGEVLVLDIQSDPVASQGDRVGVRVRARDVTEAAQFKVRAALAEGRLGLLDAEFGLAFWTTDDNLRFTSSSGVLLGVEGSLVGTSLRDFFPPSTPEPPPVQAHLRALAGDSATYEVEWGGMRLRALLEPLRSEIGGIKGVGAVAFDTRLIVQSVRARSKVPSIEARHEAVHPPEDLTGLRQEVVVGGIRISPTRFEVEKNGRKIHLTPTEFKLLTHLAEVAGAVVPREVLARAVWGHSSYSNGASLTMAISRLREKLEDDSNDPAIIQTVRGVGYRLGDE